MRKVLYNLSVTVLFIGAGLMKLQAQNDSLQVGQEEYKPLRLDAADEIENQRLEGKDILKAKGHVRFSQDTLTATCDQAAFFRDMQMAILIGNVILTDRHRIIFCEKARYYAKQRKSVCQGNVIFIDKSTTLVADSLVYFQNVEQLNAQGKVVVFDSLESVTIYGEECFYDVRKKYANVKGHPYMIQFDSTVYKGQNTARMSRGLSSNPLLDSLGKPIRNKPLDHLTAKSLFVESFIDKNKIILNDSVSFVREKLHTVSQKATFLTKKENLMLEIEPRATYERNIMTGDTMQVQFRDKHIRTIYVKGHSEASSEADVHKKKMHRLRAKEMTMYIDDNKVRMLEAKGNAYNLYYLENKEGVNEISGPRINLFFNEEGRLARFKVEGGTEGTYFPEKFEEKAGK